MKTIALTFVALATFLIAGCAPPANTNTATNTNSNANSKPVAAAPTADSLMAMDKAAQEAWSKGESKWFEDNLSSKFVMYRMGQRMGKSEVVKWIGSNKCDMKSMSLTEPALLKVNDDTYVLTYKASYDGTCTADGKSEKLPPEVRASTVVIREGEKWAGAWHGEIAIIDPKNPPPPPSTSTEKKPAPAASNSNTMANSSSNSSGNASNSAPPAAMSPSANTDALVKAHQSGWEAFKAKDAKWFNDHIADSFGVVNPAGMYVGSKAEAIKGWTETMKCEGITSVKVSDGFSTMISPTVEILTVKGAADGTCDGHKNGDLYQTAVYVKEGDTWKLAYMMEEPGM